MALLEKPRCIAEMALGEGLDFHRRHRRRTIPLLPMPKTLTGEELQVDDAPARDSELFLVDGNNLAYRAFFALPEELATSDGFPTHALLRFPNTLFKLPSDSHPR